MIMEAVKRNVCRGVIFLMACLTCVVVFGSGLIAWAVDTTYSPFTTYTRDFGIYGSKTLEGRDFQDNDTFTFQIEPEGEDTPVPMNESGIPLETVTITPDSDKNSENFDFGAAFTFKDPGNYTYNIFEIQSEEGAALPYITYDKTRYKLTVTVGVKEDTGNETGGEGAPSGETDASANGESNAPATAGSEGEGDPIVDPSDPVENNITPADGGEENGPSGDGDNQSGGDDAQSKESVQKELEVTNVKVEKSSSSDGEWTVVYDGPPPTDKQYCAFTNVYGGASIPLTGTKTLEGRKYQKGDTFTFIITSEDDGNTRTEVTIQPTSGSSAKIDFGMLYFDPDDLGKDKEKTFTYTITEKQGEIDGMTYDTAPRTVQIKVTTLEGGKMKAEVVSPVDGSLSWTNTWEGPDDPGDYPETPPEEPDEPDEPDTPEDPVTPDEPDVPDTPDTPDEPNTPNEPTLPQTGQNWRLVWILVITGAVLVLVGILGKKGYHGKHEA